jgi:hypothetical protein
MENGPFIDDFPIKTSIYKGFSMAMLNNQRVISPKKIRPAVAWEAKTSVCDSSHLLVCKTWRWRLV